MNIKVIKILGILFLAALLNACYNDCSDFEPEGAPTFKFQVMKTDSSEVIDSLIKIAYYGDTLSSEVWADHRVDFQINEPPAIKNKTSFEDSLFVFYNDTLRSRVMLGISKTKGTCYDVYKLSRVTLNDSTFCTSNCTNVVYEVRF